MSPGDTVLSFLSMAPFPQACVMSLKGLEAKVAKTSPLERCSVGTVSSPRAQSSWFYEKVLLPLLSVLSLRVMVHKSNFYMSELQLWTGVRSCPTEFLEPV